MIEPESALRALEQKYIVDMELMHNELAQTKQRLRALEQQNEMLHQLQQSMNRAEHDLHQMRSEVENIAKLALFCVQAFLICAKLSWTRGREFVMKVLRYLPIYHMETTKIDEAYDNPFELVRQVFHDRRNIFDSSDTYASLHNDKVLVDIDKDKDKDADIISQKKTIKRRKVKSNASEQS